ncbi:MAG: PhoH family protein [Limnochordia bacterium]|nr:PhoH family protein [Bacillota bacterium]
MKEESVQTKFVVNDNTAALAVFGRGDEHLRLIEKRLPVKIIPRGNELTLIGPPGEVEKASQVLRDISELVKQGRFVSSQEVMYAIALAEDGEDASINELSGEVIQVSARGKPISPKTMGQKRYIEAMRRNGIVFCIGPAGTGKTYLAMAMAVAGLKRKEYGRLILTRPAVEAGEKLGFLPGDLQDKVDPYLRPLYDALYDILGVEGYQKLVERRAIEVAPLAYMRGRTLDDSFIILDEAQNTTSEQMKMFLTRLGFGSKAVITGDITQIDLPPGKESGLIEAQRVLGGIDGLEFVHLGDRDVVRHPLVQRIVKAYERYHILEEMKKAGSRTMLDGQEPKLA